MCTVQRLQRLSVCCYAQLHTKMHQQQHKALTQVVPEGGGCTPCADTGPSKPWRCHQHMCSRLAACRRFGMQKA